MNHNLLLASALLGLTGCALTGDRPGGARSEDPAPSGPPELRQYKEAHYRALGDDFVGSLTEGELRRQILQRRVVYLGDHHDDRELHRHWLTLIDSLRGRGVDIAMGIEAIGRQDEGAVTDYLQSRISERELRRLIRARWPGSWLDSNDVDADFYLALLARARDSGVKVFALEPTPRRALRFRDAIMANNILAAADRHPRSLIVVIAGHAHLLGHGQLIERVGLSWVALGARPSVTLRRKARSFAAPPDARYLVTESGVLLRRRASR